MKIKTKFISAAVALAISASSLTLGVCAFSYKNAEPVAISYSSTVQPATEIALAAESAVALRTIPDSKLLVDIMRVLTGVSAKNVASDDGTLYALWLAAHRIEAQGRYEQDYPGVENAIWTLGIPDGVLCPFSEMLAEESRTSLSLKYAQIFMESSDYAAKASAYQYLKNYITYYRTDFNENDSAVSAILDFVSSYKYLIKPESDEFAKVLKANSDSFVEEAEQLLVADDSELAALADSLWEKSLYADMQREDVKLATEIVYSAQSRALKLVYAKLLFKESASDLAKELSRSKKNEDLIYKLMNACAYCIEAVDTSDPTLENYISTYLDASAAHEALATETNKALVTTKDLAQKYAKYGMFGSEKSADEGGIDANN